MTRRTTSEGAGHGVAPRASCTRELDWPEPRMDGGLRWAALRTGSAERPALRRDARHRRDPARTRSGSTLDCHSPSPALNVQRALERTCFFFCAQCWLQRGWVAGYVGTELKIPLLSVPWGLGCRRTFQRLLLIQRGRRRTQDPQLELPEGCVQLAFTPSAGPEPRGTKRLGLDLPPSPQQFPRGGVWAPDPECGARALPPFAAWGRVRICLVNGLNTLPPVLFSVQSPMPSSPHASTYPRTPP